MANTPAKRGLRPAFVIPLPAILKERIDGGWVPHNPVRASGQGREKSQPEDGWGLVLFPRIISSTLMIKKSSQAHANREAKGKIMATSEDTKEREEDRGTRLLVSLSTN